MPNYPRQINDTDYFSAAIEKINDNFGDAAEKASPALTGTPTAPTATKGANTTQLATTAFVAAGLADKLDSEDYTAADVLVKIKTVDGSGSGLDADTLDGQEASAFAAASHPHGAVTADGKVGSAANKAVYTGNGGAVQAGTLPVAAGGTGVATLPSGQALIGNGTGGVQGKAIDAAPTINSDNLVKSGGVYTALSGKSDVGHPHADKAPLASPALTGTPTAPTPATGDNSTQVATTAYVRAAVAALLDSGNAVRYRGSLAGGAAIPGGDAGDLYSVSTAGSIGTHAVDAGDMLLCIVDGTAAGNSANWAVLQGSLAASALLAKLLTVDGVGSGLDADTLDGQEASAFAAAGHGHALADSGITGALPVSKGGTGATTAAAARTALGVTPANIGAAETATYTATITATWTGSAAPYTQSVAVTGILATDAPIVDVVLDADTDTALAQLEAWGMVSRIDTAAGSITITCLEDKPTVAIPVQLKVVR